MNATTLFMAQETGSGLFYKKNSWMQKIWTSSGIFFRKWKMRESDENWRNIWIPARNPRKHGSVLIVKAETTYERNNQMAYKIEKYDTVLLSEAKQKIRSVYEYHYGESSRLSNKLMKLMNEIDDVIIRYASEDN